MDELSPVLIANRGEIAVRVARTVAKLGLRSLGVFTDADADALHVERVHEAARIGSYLSIPDLLNAAQAMGARAVHPGYGFLSESPAFAQAVIDAGLVWVGPPPSAIELMGDKGQAKAAAARAGVPVVRDGAGGEFPVVVKAVAGGGGKGMRVVRSADELDQAIESAKREARAAFGDDRVIVERWIEQSRHIEIQVVADRHGTVLHFGERECSLQRRHQKVIEEAPSPAVSPQLRACMGAAAVGLAKACGYEGAGTVEFITSRVAAEFFFLEMNTRLQVEHPVTEFVYGVDLVELQLRVAIGEELPFAQEELVPHGHAVEARLYAEDPANGFLPAVGRVRRYRPPAGVRVDSGVREGSEVGTQFDPMLAKIVAHGTDRGEALRRLDRALGELQLLGVSTNAAFSRALLAREDIRAGDMDTGLLERVLDQIDLGTPGDLLPAAALAAAGSAHPPGPWRRRFGQGEVRVWDGVVTFDGHGRAARVGAAVDSQVAIELDGIVRRYAVVAEPEAIWIAREGHHLEALTESADHAGSTILTGSLEAPMPGTVLLVSVANGDSVTESDVLLVIESMKMELSITAPHAGVVHGLTLQPGDQVARKQPLLAVTPEDTA